MLRGFRLSLAIILLLMPVLAGAEPPHRQHIYKWHGYGFLPGYHQPPSNSVPVYGPKGAIGDDTQGYVPSYYTYGGGHYYFGRPGFFRGRYNGGTIGPCWTQTPIGPMWNCG